MAPTVNEANNEKLIPEEAETGEDELEMDTSINDESVDSEEDLPPYLRGIGWRNVEKELRKDMRLGSSVTPISYFIDLHILVRGYRRAERSTFKGSVFISLNIFDPIDEIELHSVDLNVESAELVATAITNIATIKYNRERETVIFKFSKTVQPTFRAMLRVDYNGICRMRGMGLYESWNIWGDSSPTISLVTNCEPTGARLWFPCFDEPDKKAKFELRVIHPTELAAYSNTKGKTRTLDYNLSETVFDQTVPLPTYVVALALTEQPVTETHLNGQKIRVIGKKCDYDGLEFLKKAIINVRSRVAFHHVPFIPEKTDWLLVNDLIPGAMENPGLITSQFDASYNTKIHELVHMYFGNLVTLRSWEQLWINEGFADFFETDHRKFDTAYITTQTSLHEPPMHKNLSYSKSQFLSDHLWRNMKVHYYKAGQLLSLIKRFIGKEKFDNALNRYLLDNVYGNGDSEMMIKYLSAESPEVRAILTDWIYQPGMVLLTVKKQEERVIIQQRRFMRIDFRKDLRDTKTRFTIPIYYTIDNVDDMIIFSRNEEQLIVKVPTESTFTIDNLYPWLYLVDYKDETIEHQSVDAEGTITVSPEDHIKKYNESWHDRFAALYNSAVLNKTKKELLEMYLVKNETIYLMCHKDLKNRVSAKRFLFDLIISNEMPVRNLDLGRIANDVNRLHPGILLEFLSEEHTNIECLCWEVWQTIRYAAEEEEGGFEKLREIVRVNPSFAANFYYIITRLFEDEFIKKEMPTDPKIKYSSYYD